ncbi:MAG: tRNA (guanine(46)-N(7))-methyltransferase TrmB [Parachlamydiaceae bacterium]|nr:tRNA (guanine(46)-N(7))-methyltransferase TrmB [Parachlamydiaceae bacterium]
MKPANFKSPFDWNNRHITIHDKIWYLPKQFYDFDSFQFSGWSHPEVFEKQQPICIEYCSGNGAWIAERALKNPHFNWVAVEKKFVRARKIWTKLKSLNLTNLLIASAEGSLITQKYFPSNSVKSVYINFPDPWPKTRHAKHRIIQTPFIEDIWRILENNGDLTIVTDDPDYSEMVHKVLQQSLGFQSLHPHPFYTVDYPDYGTSYFEDLWREKGKTIRYHVYRKVNGNDGS